MLTALMLSFLRSLVCRTGSSSLIKYNRYTVFTCVHVDHVDHVDHVKQVGYTQ